jgi:hypothetical protein
MLADDRFLVPKTNFKNGMLLTIPGIVIQDLGLNHIPI